jgi:hydroxymethylbilane synthase
MAELKKITLGTRGSKLSLAQTELVVQAFQRVRPELIIGKKIITTKGDVNQSPIPLDTVGKAWFTEEIEQALQAGEIDIAVHSLKDMPPHLPIGLKIITALPRADAADVLISKSGAHLSDLNDHSIVGTDSIRRKALLLAMRPDLIVESIRGNVDTRLKKLETERYDAIVIAAAGLKRLHLEDRITERFDPTVFIPAPGQGILAVELREDRIDLSDIVHEIEDAGTAIAAEIERIFSNTIGGGCKLPIGCYTEINNGNVSIHAVVGTMDGNHVVSKSVSGLSADGKKLAEGLAQDFLNDPVAKYR